MRIEEELIVENKTKRPDVMCYSRRSGTKKTSPALSQPNFLSRLCVFHSARRIPVDLTKNRHFSYFGHNVDLWVSDKLLWARGLINVRPWRSLLAIPT